MNVTVIAPPSLKTSMDAMREKAGAEAERVAAESQRLMMMEMRETLSRQLAEIHMRMLERRLGLHL